MTVPITQFSVGLDFGDKIYSIGRLAIRNGIIYFEYNVSVF